MGSVLQLSDSNEWTKSQSLSQVIKELFKKGKAWTVQILQFLRESEVTN